MSGGLETNPNVATLILNACPDPKLLEHRAKVLNDAGYYTSSARTAGDAAQLALSLDCSLALICYSFSAIDQRALLAYLKKFSPRTSIICLHPDLDSNQRIFISRVEQALEQPISIEPKVET